MKIYIINYLILTHELEKEKNSFRSIFNVNFHLGLVRPNPTSNMAN